MFRLDLGADYPDIRLKLENLAVLPARAETAEVGDLRAHLAPQAVQERRAIGPGAI